MKLVVALAAAVGRPGCDCDAAFHEKAQPKSERTGLVLALLLALVLLVLV